MALSGSREWCQPAWRLGGDWLPLLVGERLEALFSRLEKRPELL
jgi:hypothetical protein